ncbi:MAG TPA: hypothetical protein ENK59_00510 [Thioploca sp.]|nr:hypothetical protein [Thioploca sp.]
MSIFKRLLFGTILGITTIAQAATDCNQVTEIPPAECESLLELYHSTNGDNWGDNEGWNETNTPCSWYGITCENNGVVEIESHFNNLIGQIPNFSALHNLRELYLVSDKLTGTIPDFNLPNLEELYLFYEQLTGTIPNFNLPKLKHLDLHSNTLNNNELNVIIPNFNLSNLEWLSLSHSQLTGTIPNFNLPNLQYLYLDNNKLTGTIPNFNLPNLQNLHLDNNELTGSIPNFSLPNLEFLSLNNNNLTGFIPDFGASNNLKVIFLEKNQLTGSIPNFNALSNLKRLYLGYNKLTGTIPSFTLPNLNALSLKSNQLTGPIPTYSDTIIKLYTIDLRNNPLCKQKDFDYSAWSFPFNTLSAVDIVVELFVDYSKDWQAQLDTFPICGTNKDYAFIEYLESKLYYVVGEIVNIKTEVSFKTTDKVDLWIAIELPSKEFIYLTPSITLSSTPQFFKNNLNTIKDRFSVISDFIVPKNFAGDYTFYTALIEAGKNPWQDGMQVIKYIEQTSISLFDK